MMFDITKYEHSDADVVSIDAEYTGDVEYKLNRHFEGYRPSITFNRDDAVALAKHFRLIE